MSHQHLITFGSGSALVDSITGSPIAFIHLEQPQRSYLLPTSLAWHSVHHYWGCGTAITSNGAFSWSAANDIKCTDNSQTLLFYLTGAGLQLTVTRAVVGDKLEEKYEWTNMSDQSLLIDDLAIQTPFGDYYPSAKLSLTTCVNAHIFAGGSWAWAMAEPMDGEGASLGLIVRQGAINAYSIESRSAITGSNIRGHILLHVTDFSHNPEAFGGQPQIELKPHESYTLAWDLGWYLDAEAFLKETDAPVHFDHLSAKVEQDIRMTVRDDKASVIAVDKDLLIDHDGNNFRLTSNSSGTYRVQIGSAHTEIMFHDSLTNVVRVRARYILDHQRALGRPGLMSAAFVPTDTRYNLPIDDGGWPDWTDGSERIGMAVFLQRARNAGILDDEVDKPLQEWTQFAQKYLVDETGAIRRGSSQEKNTFGGRFYDVPWLVEFFNQRYIHTHNVTDLDFAMKLWRRSFELGGEHFLAIGLSESLCETINLLKSVGRDADAQMLRNHLIVRADYFLNLGNDLPDHEVAFEQSIVAPLINLLIDAYRLTNNHKYYDSISGRLPWLLSFGGQQPDSRMHGIAIRHWDDYWFGINKLFGDVFPHYWSVLTSTVLLRLPKGLRTHRFTQLAQEILEANMANYDEKGAATCAFVFPSNIDGRSAHCVDPLANDQDWHLAIWLRLIDHGYLVMDD